MTKWIDTQTYPSNAGVFTALSIEEAVTRASEILLATEAQLAIWLKGQVTLSDARKLAELKHFQMYPGTQTRFFGSDFHEKAPEEEKNILNQNQRAENRQALFSLFSMVMNDVRLMANDEKSDHVDAGDMNIPQQPKTEKLFGGRLIRILYTEPEEYPSEGTHIYDTAEIDPALYAGLLKAMYASITDPKHAKPVNDVLKGAAMPEAYVVRPGDWVFAPIYGWKPEKYSVHTNPLTKRNSYAEGRVVNVYDCCP